MSADIEIGTVIQGTLRPAELIPALLDELDRIDSDEAEALRLEYCAVLAKRAWTSAEADWLLGELFDALSERAPEGVFFGAHPGDGADFGWWPVEDDR